jgi:hypothetical protein
MVIFPLDALLVGLCFKEAGVKQQCSSLFLAGAAGIDAATPQKLVNDPRCHVSGLRCDLFHLIFKSLSSSNNFGNICQMPVE